MKLTRIQMRNRLVREARKSRTFEEPDNPAARRKQATVAWKVAAVIAAGDGMDAAWFRDCLEAIGFLPYDRTPGRYFFGQAMPS